MTLNIPDISEGHAFPDMAGQDGIILRVCLGAAFEDKEWRARLATYRTHYAHKLLATYIFLSGPGRGVSIARQIGYYAERAPADGGTFIDWENDEYKDAHGVTHSFGIQPFSAVVEAIKEARKHGMNPGVYASLSLFTPFVVHALVALNVPVLWIAAYDGLNIPDRILHSGPIIGHQYTGTGLDRSHFFTTREAFAAWAGNKPVAPAEPPSPPTGHVSVLAGSWWDYAVSGNPGKGYQVSRALRRTGGFSADTGTLVVTTWGERPRKFAKLVSGAYAGSWVDLNDEPDWTAA